MKFEGFRVSRFHPVAQFGECFKEGRAKDHLLLTPFMDGARQPLQAGNPVLMFARPFRKRVGVELVNVLADLSLAKLLLLGVGRFSNHLGYQRNGGGNLQLVERQTLRIEVIDGQFPIG